MLDSKFHNVRLLTLDYNLTVMSTLILILVHWNLVCPVLMVVEQFQIDKQKLQALSGTYDKNAWNTILQYRLHYFSVALLQFCTKDVFKYYYCTL